MDERSESDTLIKNIVPKLKEMGWEIKRMRFEVPCSAGKIDILYTDGHGASLAVVEAKRPGKSIKNVLEKQAIPYAKSIKAPIAIVWDGVDQLETWHLKEGSPLRDYDGNIINHSNSNLLNENNLLILQKIPSLKRKIKNPEEIEKIFKKLNVLGKDIGLTVGVERVTEIAKILFIKILCDNETYLNANDWNKLRGDGKSRTLVNINHLLSDILQNKDINIPKLNIPEGKSHKVWEILELLETINFNNRYYGDIAGSLFEHFLSSRARAGGTNDLGQYFTPKKINELIYHLSGFELGRKVYDPFCGTGGILLEFFRQQNFLCDKSKREFAKSYLYGSELAQPVSLLAKMNMVIAGDGHTNIFGCDSLSRENRYVKNDERFDIVATNMPFVPCVPNDVPDGYFSMACGQNDVSKFIEHSINRCEVGGRIILITGKGFLSEKATSDFRKKLLVGYCLESVYTLYGGVFDPYTQAFSVMLVISKRRRNQEEFIDFFSIENDNDIKTVRDFHDKENRYENGYYKIKVTDILRDEYCSLTRSIYKTNSSDILLSDLATLVNKKKATDLTGEKLTTPNAIEDGLHLIRTQSKKINEGNNNSFCYKVESGAIIIANIVGSRKTGRYLGSAIAGNNVGDLITAEYHQLIPNDPADIYFILNWLRSDSFQRIIECAKGTGGQQRIGDRAIMNAPIPKPTGELRKEAYRNLINAEGKRISDVIDTMNLYEQKDILRYIKNRYENK